MSENKKIESEFKEKLVAINRITKVVKGGEDLDLRFSSGWKPKRL